MNHVNITQPKFKEMLVKTINMHHVNDTWYHTGRGSSIDTLCNPLRLVRKHYIQLILSRPGVKKKRRMCIRCKAMGKRVDLSYECRVQNINSYTKYSTKKAIITF